MPCFSTGLVQRRKHATIPLLRIPVLMILMFLPSCTLGNLLTATGSSGTLLLTMGMTAAKTLLPGIDMNIATYGVSAAGPNGATFARSTTQHSLRIDGVPAGQWTVTVTGTNDDGYIIAQGASTATVSPGTETSLSVIVTPPTGYGSIDLSVVWQAGDLQAPLIEAQLLPAIGSPLPLEFDIGPGIATSSATRIPTGYYTLSVKLHDASHLAMGAVEVARIFKDQVTTGSFDFTLLNKADSAVMVDITPVMNDPIPVVLEGQVMNLAVGTAMTVVATVPADAGNVTRIWHVNGEPISVGESPSCTFGDALPVGVYRLDVTVFTADGLRAGSDTHTFVVQEGTAAINLRAIDGGSEYFANWPNSLTTDPSFFPIGVWFESVLEQADVAKDMDAGINLYVALTANSDLSVLAANGMKAILQAQEWSTQATATGSEAIAGWLLYDEVDMILGPVNGPSTLTEILQRLPAGDGRIRYNNYGKGVMFTTWETDAQAARFVNDFQDVVSADLYWFTDESLHSFSQGGTLLGDGIHALTEAETHVASNYGATIDRLRSLVTPVASKPVWSYIELGHPSSEADWPSITPAEVSAAVWSSIIHGARGIVYFNHSFGGSFLSQHVLREPYYSAIRDEVRKTNQRVKGLASVLNAPFIEGLVTSSAKVDVMVKYYRGMYYLFAGSRVPGHQTVPFTLSGLGNADVTVLFEDRTIIMSHGAFTDSFTDGNSVHIYRIDGVWLPDL